MTTMMRAQLVEDRIGHSPEGHERRLPAGTVVDITGINPTGHMRAHYHGYGLSVSQDQATPIYDEEVSPMTQTTAERVAALLGDDGMRFETEDGREFAELLEAEHATEQHDWTRSATRYLFPDGSAIVEQGGAWDIEGPTPFSWAGAE